MPSEKFSVKRGFCCPWLFFYVNRNCHLNSFSHLKHLLRVFFRFLSYPLIRFQKLQIIECSVIKFKLLTMYQNANFKKCKQIFDYLPTYIVCYPSWYILTYLVLSMFKFHLVNQSIKNLSCSLPSHSNLKEQCNVVKMCCVCASWSPWGLFPFG